MAWNYRLFKQKTPLSAEGEYLYFVAECYYDKDGKPELHSTADHNHVTGSSPEETHETYKMMHEAFAAPIISLDAEGNFVEAKDGE